MPIRVGMVSLGCSKNLVDSERMLFKLRKHGYTLVKEPGDADVVVVNTCGFIQSAKEEAIETILELAELKKEARLKSLIVTGCLAQRYKEEIVKEMDEIPRYLTSDNFNLIVQKLKQKPQLIIVDEIDYLMNNLKTIEVAEKYLNKGVVALDLAGDEKHFKTKDYEELLPRCEVETIK